MNYKLELKQIVEFPRCRIYRDFIQTLITTKSIRGMLPSYRTMKYKSPIWGYFHVQKE